MNSITDNESHEFIPGKLLGDVTYCARFGCALPAPADVHFVNAAKSAEPSDELDSERQIVESGEPMRFERRLEVVCRVCNAPVGRPCWPRWKGDNGTHTYADAIGVPAKVGSRLTAEERMLSDTILDVIDGGCTCNSGEKHPWEFYEDGTEGGNVDAFTEDMANQQRLRFRDAVVARVREIKKFDDAEALHTQKG